MKRSKMKQSPFTPLIFMAIIMCGFVLGTKGKDAANQVDQTNGSQVQTEENQTAEGNQLATDDKKAEENSQAEQEEKSDAEQALVEGTHIQSEIEDEYAKSVVKDYCNRKVVACSSSNLERYHEKNLYRQSFDQVTGYMTLVQMTAKEDTIAQWKVATELENVTIVLVFPDMSYVFLEKNESIECTLPKGVSTILYIGKKLSGSIEVKIQENEQITAKRM